MSNMNFLIADVIEFSSDTKITSSQGGAAQIKSKHFSELGSRTTLVNLLEESFFGIFLTKMSEIDK